MEKEKLIQQLRIYAMVKRLQEILEEDRQKQSIRMKEFKLTARPIVEIPNKLMEYKDGKQRRRERRAEERRQ